MAAEEKSIQTEVSDVVKAKGFGAVEARDQVAVKKMWVACRKAMHQGAASEAAGETEIVSPEEIAFDLKSHWKSSHGIVLPDAWLLNTTGLTKLWNDSTCSTPVVSIILM